MAVFQFWLEVNEQEESPAMEEEDSGQAVRDYQGMEGGNQEYGQALAISTILVFCGLEKRDSTPVIEEKAAAMTVRRSTFQATNRSHSCLR
jgi:hypothetical protein